MGDLVPDDSESSKSRYQVWMRMIKSAIVTARYEVDKENMKIITPNRIFWVSDRRPLLLNIGRTDWIKFSRKNQTTHIIIYAETGTSDA